MRWEGKTQLVRRVLWDSVNGQIPSGKVIKCTCESHDCVNIEHLELTTHKKIALQCGALGLMSGPVRTAKIAATKQKTHGKLTLDIADEIRSSDKTGVALSIEYCLPQSKISKIIRGKAWVRPIASPWAGLQIVRAA
jgi:HNH endonuclease